MRCRRSSFVLIFIVLPPAAGPHPRRELTPTPHLGFPCPRFGMAAGALSIYIPDLPGPPDLLRSGLSSLLLQHFAGVPHAFLLVRIRLAETSNVRRDLAHELAIDPGDRDVRLLLDRDIDAGGNVEHDRVRVAKR